MSQIPGGLIYRLVGRKSYETNEWFIAMKDFINVLFNINSMCNPMVGLILFDFD